MKKINKISTLGILFRVFIPAITLSLIYLVLGLIFRAPNELLLCISATVVIVFLELGSILFASKKENGTFSVSSAFFEQKKQPWWQILVIAFMFFGIAGLLSAFFAPLENSLFHEVRLNVLSKLPQGFDTNNIEYVKSFSMTVRVITCIYCLIFNGIILPTIEELYFRGYLTSHYEKQNCVTPVLMTVLFSIYHFWLPFNNLFRILAFTPVMCVAYKKKNIYISICFHCLCNIFSVVSYAMVVLS